MSPSILLKRFLSFLALNILMGTHLSAQQPADISHFKNYVKANDQLHTCGKIDEEALAVVAARGIKTVISLNTESPSKVILMKQRAKALDIQYVHVPVSWKAPSLESLKLFFKVMDQHPGAEVLVHCRLNWRASAFVYLYRTLRLKEDEALAKAALHQVWKPERYKTWERFMQTAKNYFETNR